MNLNPLQALRPPGAFDPMQAGAGSLPGAIPLREFQELPGNLLQPASPALPGAATAPNSFEGMLGRLVTDVNTKQAAASDAVHGLMTGQGVPLHQAVIAMEEAGVSFQLMVEVRNKLVESYQELMRMQV
ncbi:MAG: hypothetical protein RJA22_2627 [Verrucomicrobiota bacterium]|jgi:flagellar hook-basal body complex protein FliE